MKIAISSCDLMILGEAEEYYKFFQNNLDNNELLDRLYRRYVKRENVNATKEYLKSLEIKKSTNSLAKKIRKSLEDQAECSELRFARTKRYIPVRIVLFDEPYHLLSRNIPLEDYDNNEGEPFWMRPDYLIEKYGKKAGL